MTHEDWCDLLFTIEGKDNRKNTATQIKKIETLIAASLSDSNKSIRVTRRKKASNDVQLKQQGEKMTKHHDAHRYCILFKKARRPE